MGILINLDPELEQRLGALSAVTGRDTQDQIREAILRGLEDMEDIAAADAVMERVRRGEEPIYSLAEVMRDLGLDDRADADGSAQPEEDRSHVGEADHPLPERAGHG